MHSRILFFIRFAAKEDTRMLLKISCQLNNNRSKTEKKNLPSIEYGCQLIDHQYLCLQPKIVRPATHFGQRDVVIFLRLHRPYTALFDTGHPCGIAAIRRLSDVRQAIQAAIRYNIPVGRSLRSRIERTHLLHSIPMHMRCPTSTCQSTFIASIVQIRH